MLAPTPTDRLTDAQGRPYFLWDCEVTLEEWRALIADPDEDVRAYWIGKAMRQAKPDDVVTLVVVEHMRDLWPKLERYLGRRRDFWAWLLLERWAERCPDA